MRNAFETITHAVDVCVVGGGMAGLCAALASARHGAKTLLMQDRPVLGGNASSEIRMWICGAHGRDNRETGMIEELLLENQYLNPEKNYSLWDGVLLGKAKAQRGLETLLNCACMDGEMTGERLESITGYQTTTQQFHRVRAKIFIDCSGDSVLQPITGAPCRMGREGRAEFGESIAPETADEKTMGMSCLLQARQEAYASEFTPPPWAKKITREQLAPYRLPDMESPGENFWYLELGGQQHAIRDTESLRDELLAEALGLWDYIKNAPENKEKNKFWHLDWLGFLPGKRESRRYIGDYVMTQADVRSGGHFPDLVAYGGWTMDDHHPGGMRTQEPPTIFHPAPSPFGIPYRCLYSKTVENLMFAGRNISVSHAALSASRVMATCALLGQAAGTAAALAVEKGATPRGVYQRHIALLRGRLMADDCYLPFSRQEISPLCGEARYFCTGQRADALRDGVDRPLDGQSHALDIPLGEALEITWERPVFVTALRLIFDSELNRDSLPETQMGLNRPMLCNRPLGWRASRVPAALTRAFTLEARTEKGWELLQAEENNYQRLYIAPVGRRTDGLRLTPRATWGAKIARLFAAYVE